jgi:hypothetical protein
LLTADCVKGWKRSKVIATRPDVRIVQLGADLTRQPVPHSRRCSLKSAATKIIVTRVLISFMSAPDSNNHSFDENLRLGNLWDGTEQAAALLLMDVASK